MALMKVDLPAPARPATRIAGTGMAGAVGAFVRFAAAYRQAKRLELAVEVGAFEPGFFRDARHAALFAGEMMHEVGALKGVARLAQRQFKVESGGDRRRRCFRRRRCRHVFNRCRPRHRLDGQRALDRRQQFGQRDRLFKEIGGADARGLDRGVDGRVPAHHQHRHREEPRGRPFLEQGHAVGVGHPDVEQDEVVLAGKPCRARFGRVLRQRDAVALVAQDFRQQFADADFVVYNQDVGHCLACAVWCAPVGGAWSVPAGTGAGACLLAVTAARGNPA
jgi:hypothetical protein